MASETPPQLLAQSLALLQDARAKILELKRAQSQPAAIIGMACRLPGGVASTEQYWDLLVGQRSGISALDPARFPPSEDARGAAYRAGFVHDFDRFDHRFFQITPREARTLDPQQRLFLHTALEALHDAGLGQQHLAGRSVGVFVGANNTDYLHELLKRPELVDENTVVGNALSIIANRLSYFLDLRGASLVVDTACSSSLVAIHLALAALRRREIDVAVVGGVSLICSPDNNRSHLLGLPISKDHRCFSFDARANGYVRGEGCGVVVLKRLADTARDRIHATVRGSAVNQDARTNGLTAPSGLAQRDVLQQALRDAGVEPDDVGLVEAHGTGTRLGDPIEFEALASVYGKHQPCALGAVKSNLGHLEAASGIAGLIKAALCLRARTIAPNHDFQAPNPLLAVDGTRLFVPTRALPWPAHATCAAVSSFGAGGTNAHVILGLAPAGAAADATADVGTDARVAPAGAPRSAGHLFSLSAINPARLAAYARSVAADLARSPAGAEDLAALSFASFHRHTAHDHRLLCFARSGDELRARLEAFAAGEEHPLAACQRASRGAPPRIWFVFPGQGAQWPGMARELLGAEPVFADAIARCGRALAPYLERELADCLSREEAYDDIGLVQPMLFAVQVALARLWEHRGVAPGGVIGHSMGEVAAAVVAGKLSLEDGARIIGLRSRLLRELRGQGRMLFVAAPREDVERLLAELAADASLAVVNAPDACVVAGAPAAVDALAARLAARNVFHRPVKVDVASHCAQVDPILDRLAAELAGLAPRSSETPMLSTVTGASVDSADLAPAYWLRNLRAPVLFGPTVERAIDEGDLFIELSPHPILLESIAQIAERRGKAVAAIASLHRDVDQHAAFLVALAAGAAAGAGVEPHLLCPTDGRFRRPLGRMTWEVERFWPFADLAAARAPSPAPAPPSLVRDAAAPTAPAATPAAVSHERATRIVKSKVAEIVEDSASALDAGIGFFQMGMTSIMLTRLACALNRETGLALTPLQVVRNGTIDALARFIASLARPRDSAADGAPSAAAPAPAASPASPALTPTTDRGDSVLSELDSLLAAL